MSREGKGYDNLAEFFNIGIAPGREIDFNPPGPILGSEDQAAPVPQAETS